MPFSGTVTTFLLNFCLVFFAFATIPGWSYYSETCLNYLTGGSKSDCNYFRIFYIMVVAAGPYLSFSLVWQLADLLNGLMALQNLSALILLAGIVSKETKGYFTRILIIKKRKKL